MDDMLLGRGLVVGGGEEAKKEGKEERAARPGLGKAKAKASSRKGLGSGACARPAQRPAGSGGVCVCV